MVDLPARSDIMKKLNMRKNWVTYRELLMEVEQQLQFKKFEDIRHLLTDWLQYHQLNEVFKIDKRKGFAIEILRFEKELLENNVKLLSQVFQK